MGDPRGGKRRKSIPIVKVVEDDFLPSRSESEGPPVTGLDQPNKKPKLEPKSKEVLIDPSEIAYTPLVLTETGDHELQQAIINDPVRGYFYYEYLGDKLGLVLRYFTKKSGMVLLRNRLKYLTLNTWAQFIKEYRFISHDKEIWRKIGNKIDILSVASNAVTYHRVLVELMNCIYIGYTKGKIPMNWELSDKLLCFISKCSRSYTKNLNIQYYKLLSKEFKEFFGFQSGYGNTLDLFVKRESLYIAGDELDSFEKTDALKWTADEKDIFYESLARYGINRVDDIAALLPNKSAADIMSLYKILSNELSKYKSDKKLRKKLVSFDDMPVAYEMSELFIKTEEKLASSIERLDEIQFGSLHGEYRGKYYKEIADKCKDLFNTKQMEKLLVLLNGLNANFGEVRTQSIVEFALLDIYNLVREFIHELLLRLFKKKMNELTIPQQYEWKNLVKSLKNPPNPKSMVNILNVKNLNKTVKEDIDYFDENDSESDIDSENDFYPELTRREYNLMNKVDPNGIEILEDIDIWNIGISKEEVYNVSEELLSEYNCSNQLWMQLKGKLDITQKKNKITGESQSDEMHDALSDYESMDESEQEPEDANVENQKAEYENSSSEEEDLKYTEMLSNAQDIDDLQSEDELQNLMKNFDSDNEEDNSVSSDNTSSQEEFNWYDDEFVILDADTELHDKGIKRNDYVSGLDMTTKGHEYLQKLCDQEERQLEHKDLQDSLKHEHLLLTHFVSKENDDELNNKIYADLFSQLHYGGANISTKSWKPEFGGPPSMFGTLKVRQNVNHLMRNIKTNLCDSIENKEISYQMSEKFKYTYNDNPLFRENFR